MLRGKDPIGVLFTATDLYASQIISSLILNFTLEVFSFFSFLYVKSAFIRDHLCSSNGLDCVALHIVRAW